ncbi:MAG TPA: glycoside hydrolase family 15 protein [Thermodesulfobacteriota bacterium]|nr:glycoside hydrolase family 15 protein [Thermodesulfobacteriota bacterium]
MSSPIEDYAMIGDCETAALVAKNGSIDWLCFPRFDSGACFAALLGTPENGRWLITPTGKIKSIKRRYRPGTLILETDYETESGAVTIIDWMPPRSGEVDVMRIVVGRRGQVPMRMDLTIRFDYGWIVPWVRHIERGILAIAGPDTLYCRTDVELHGENMHTVADFIVSEGQRIPFELVWCHTYRKVVPMEKDVEANLRETEDWWKNWSGRCSYRGEWGDAVLRSLITLKALTYSQTGGIVAAPTTSLPEKLGGVRNWDYRFCWLRDATFTLRALMVGGYTEEACAWREWLINSVAGKPSEIQLMYGLAGERRLNEMEISWLPGYQGSYPVRIGNAAYNQHQLDVYGEVMDSLHLARCLGLTPSENAWRVQLEMMKFLETDWLEPDEGIWEVRGPRRQFTHSKVMAWVAMDRAVKAVEDFGLNGPVEKWRRLRQEIHDQVCREGFDPDLNSYVQYYGSKRVDASLLMLPLVGFIPANDPRMVGTVEAIRKNLMEDGLVYRYHTSPEIDGLPRGEGAFLICSFWMADNLALQGKYAEARNIFERLLDLRNDVGLLSEQYDPEAKRLVGNFPQAFSHVGLVNTARNLSVSRGPARNRRG